MDMVKIYLTRPFMRWMQKSGVSEVALLQAVEEMEGGLIDANLGGFLFKKRVALSGRGKRSGARTIVASKLAGRWLFLVGFLKSEQSNIDSDELKALQELAKDYLALDKSAVEILLAQSAWTEIKNVER
jgi:hypothetical protein